MDPNPTASTPNIINTRTYLSSLEDSLKESKSSKEVVELNKKLVGFARDFFRELTTNKAFVLNEAVHSKTYQFALAEVGSAIRRLCPEAFRENQAAFEGLLSEVHNAASASIPIKMQSQSVTIRASPSEIKDILVSQERQVPIQPQETKVTASSLSKTPFNPNIFNRYQSRFQAALNFKLGMLDRIQLFLKPPRTSESKLKEFQYGEYLTVSHLAEDSEGMHVSTSLKATINLLERSKLPYPDLIGQLKSALSSEGIFDGSEFQEMTQKIKNRISSLGVGKSVVIESSTKGHAMYLQITRTGRHPKLFRLVNHNSGSGITYHNSKIDHRGRQVYQRGFEIVGVSEDRLLRSSFVREVLKFRNSDDVNLLYTQILPKLEGTRPPRKDDPRLWYRSQLGDTCAVAAVLSLLRSQMTEAHYREFMDGARYETLLKNYENIKRGGGNIQRQKIASLELIGKLERRYRKHAVPFPEVLIAIKSDLNKIGKPTKLYSPFDVDFTKKAAEALPKSSTSAVVEESDVSTTNVPVTENLAQAFDVLVKAEFDAEKIPEIMRHLEPVLTVTKISSSEYRKLIAFALHIAALANAPLTKDQIYTFTSILSLTAKIIENVQNNFSRKTYRNLKNDVQFQRDYQSFQTSFESLHDKFNAMQLRIPYDAPHFQAEVDGLIRKYQARFFSI